MNIKKLVLTGAMAGAFWIVGGQTAHASDVKSLKEIPTAMRGTWYSFEAGKLSKVTYYKNKIVTNWEGKNHVSYVYKYKDHNVKTTKSKTNNWYFMTNTNKIHGYKWVKSYGWNQGAGSGNYFSVNTFNGNQVLSSAGDAGVEVDGQYYRTPELAKQLANKKYPSFKYSSEF